MLLSISKKTHRVTNVLFCVTNLYKKKQWVFKIALNHYLVIVNAPCAIPFVAIILSANSFN